jgi:hypothetical protein
MQRSRKRVALRALVVSCAGGCTILLMLSCVSSPKQRGPVSTSSVEGQVAPTITVQQGKCQRRCRNDPVAPEWN